jgi:hypothetical protein
MFTISSHFNTFPLFFLEGEIHGSILLVFLVFQQFQGQVVFIQLFVMGSSSLVFIIDFSILLDHPNIILLIFSSTHM